MKGNEHTLRTMQSHEMAVRSDPVMRSGRLRKPPWRHRVGLGGRDKSHMGTLSKPWLSRTSVLMAFFLISSVLYLTSNGASDMQGKHDSDVHIGRSLLSANDSEGGHKKPPWEKCDYEAVNLPVLWVVLYAIFVIVLFIAIAIICDDFFVPSLEVISETLNLSEDVAGATFMAAGSSAPELFTSVIGVAFESDVGVGTIVGSAVFNILIIIALTAALAGQVLNLDWRPLVRDSFFYGLSLVCFIAFCWDTQFTWWEALILLILYIVYLVLMKLNPKIMEKTEHITCGGFCRNQVAPLDAEAGEGGGETTVQPVTDDPANTVENGAPNGNALPRKLPPLGQNLTEENRKISVLSNQSLAVPGSKHIFHHVKHGELSSNFRRQSLVDGLHHPYHHHHHEHDGEHKPHDEGEKKEEEEDKKSEGSEEEPTLRPFPCLPAVNMYYPDKEIIGSTCGCLRYGLKWVLFVISFPFMCAFTWTIPNCSLPHLRKWYIASFILSIIWIAALSFGMVTLVAKMGCILRISDYTMGLVIVAIGTSVPDALSSILVARDGYGDMAVSNAIGSNVFDINLGIGLPYLIRIAINGGSNIFLLNAADQLRFENGEYGPMPPHAKFGFILLLILLLTIVAFTAVRFRLNAVIGVSFALMYVLFMVYAFVQEIVCQGAC